MLLFGHKLIKVEPWRKITSTQEINSTPPNSTIVLEDIEKYANIAKHCKENGILFACEVGSIKQAIIANALNADYILCRDIVLASEVQKVANEYLWMAKVIYVVDDEESIENVAKMGIDGIVFKDYII